MKIKTKKVYYCEYCNWHRLTRHSIEQHEKHCTLNPYRTCRMCDRNSLTELLVKYQDRFRIIEKDTSFGPTLDTEWIRGEVTIRDIERDTDGCPACTLAVIRLCGFSKYPAPMIEFDYQEARKAWWVERNTEVPEEVYL